jgi:hypothetical protein
MKKLLSLCPVRQACPVPLETLVTSYYFENQNLIILEIDLLNTSKVQMGKLVNSHLVNLIEDLTEMWIPSEINSPLKRKEVGSTTSPTKLKIPMYTKVL